MSNIPKKIHTIVLCVVTISIMIMLPGGGTVSSAAESCSESCETRAKLPYTPEKIKNAISGVLSGEDRANFENAVARLLPKDDAIQSMTTDLLSITNNATGNAPGFPSTNGRLTSPGDRGSTKVD